MASTGVPVDSWFSLMSSVVSLVGRSASGWAGPSSWPSGLGRMTFERSAVLLDGPGAGGFGSCSRTGYRGE